MLCISFLKLDYLKKIAHNVDDQITTQKTDTLMNQLKKKNRLSLSSIGDYSCSGKDNREQMNSFFTSISDINSEVEPLEMRQQDESRESQRKSSTEKYERLFQNYEERNYAEALKIANEIFSSYNKISKKLSVNMSNILTESIINDTVKIFFYTF